MPTASRKIATPLPINPKAPQPRATKLLCEVTDLSQQTVSESRAFVQHSSDYYFGLRRLDAVFKEGAPLPIELIAVGLDGKALPAPVKVDASSATDHLADEPPRGRGRHDGVRQQGAARSGLGTRAFDHARRWDRSETDRGDRCPTWSRENRANICSRRPARMRKATMF